MVIGLLLVAAAAGAGWSFWADNKPADDALSVPRTSAEAEPDAAEIMRGDFTLAVSWQPAFCETAPNRAECRSQTGDRFDATHFTLHGLWPEPANNIYCNVPQAIADADRNGQWRALPEVEMTDDLWAALETKMPGTQSLLHRHEWVKHGTCAGVSANAYYLASVNLLDALNGSAVQQLFARHTGNSLTANQIRSAFDAAFGSGAGQRVTIECERENGRTMVAELRINLSGEINEQPSVAKLMAAADTRSRGCPGGEVDRVGQQ